MSPPLRVANRLAVVLWLFILLWMGALCAGTWVLIRDGFPDSQSPLIVLGGFAFFWLIGIPVTLSIAAKPCYLLTLDSPSRIRMRWIHPHKIIRRQYSSAELSPAVIEEGHDSDGDPYFTARLDTPEGRPFHLYDGSDRERCQQACDRFNQAAFGHS